MLTHQRITSGQFDRAVSGRARTLAASLRAELGGIPGVALHDRGPELSAIVTFSVAGVNPLAPRDRLRERRIHVGALDATVARLDLGSRPVREVARAAPHDYNTEAELDVLVHEVARLARSGGWGRCPAPAVTRRPSRVEEWRVAVGDQLPSRPVRCRPTRA